MDAEIYERKTTQIYLKLHFTLKWKCGYLVTTAIVLGVRGGFFLYTAVPKLKSKNKTFFMIHFNKKKFGASCKKQSQQKAIKWLPVMQSCLSPKLPNNFKKKLFTPIL